MEKSREFKIILSVLVVLFIFSFGTVYMLLKNRSQESVLGVKDSLVEENISNDRNTGIPYILSQAPVLANSGELYEYVPRLVDIDTDVSLLTLELLDAPSWLYLENGVVLGVAPDTEDTYSFVLKVSDGYNSSQQKNYVLVQKRDE